MGLVAPAGRFSRPNTKMLGRIRQVRGESNGMIRIGLVDFDTSHVEAFTQRLNHVAIAESEWVDGATTRAPAAT